MRKLNRAVTLVLVLLLAISLVAVAGCKPKEEAPKIKIALVFDVGGLGDKSFNDSANEGLLQAAQEFDIQTDTFEPTEGGADREQLLKSAAEQGYNLVIANGFLFTDALIAVAPQFPNTKFALTDGYIPDLTDTSNVVCWAFAENEGSYLVGIAAAMKSQTGHIGFVGGMLIPLIQKFEAGYVAGAKSVNPNIIIDVNYIGSTGEAFKNPTAGKELALAQYDKGADVVYHASGASGIGVFEAAAAKQLWAIGVDGDQYGSAPAEQQPYIMTSMIKKVNAAVYDTIKKVVEGSFKGGYVTYGLKDGGVDYATSHPTALADDIKAAIEAAKAKIVSGEIVVPAEPGK